METISRTVDVSAWHLDTATSAVVLAEGNFLARARSFASRVQVHTLQRSRADCYNPGASVCIATGTPRWGSRDDCSINAHPAGAECMFNAELRQGRGGGTFCASNAALGSNHVQCGRVPTNSEKSYLKDKRGPRGLAAACP